MRIGCDLDGTVAEVGQRVPQFGIYAIERDGLQASTAAPAMYEYLRNSSRL